MQAYLGIPEPCAAGLFAFAMPLGQAVYHSDEAGRYIRLLAPLLPIMYTDMVTDGCLKGLGEQMWSMGVNILDSALGVLLVPVLVLALLVWLWAF